MDSNTKLMYRPPGREKHINIAEALDELYNKMSELEELLHKLQQDTE